MDRRATPLARAGAMLVTLAALAASSALGACDLALGIPTRDLDPHLVCTNGACACSEGFADCDGKPESGCEAELAIDQANCGACGNDCQNGTCKAGACVCHEKFVDCDGKPENGCEAALETDPKNCGQCGHDCLGGGCNSGFCQPVAVGPLENVVALQVVNGTLYVAGCGSPAPIVSRPASGGAEVPAVPASKTCAQDMIIAGNEIYWLAGTAQRSLVKNPLDKVASPAVLAPNVEVFGMAVSATSVYWYDDVQNLVLRMPVGGGAAQTVWSGANGDVLAADAGHLYFTDGADLYSVPDGSTTLTKLASIAPNVGLVDGGTLFAADDATLYSLPVTGGKPKSLASVSFAVSIAIDATNVYWGDDSEGTVKTVPRAGGATRVISRGLSLAAPLVAVDDRFVYFTDGNGKLFQVAK